MDHAFIASLKEITGARHVLTGKTATRRYRHGYRTGAGAALAVVRPATLLEMWRVLRLCVAADKIVIMQAANTGLTGGSTPDGGYDRDVVIINTLRMDKIYPLADGRQVLCLPGATLYQLEELLKPLGREPHSVIGSSCIGASVFGGVCNNSGGALVRRGPAYTELALYAQLTAAGELELVNHLGIPLGGDAEEMLACLDEGRFDAAVATQSPASDHEYCTHVRDIAAPTPARFNADPRRLKEASGSAGRLAVFALRLDTFAGGGDKTMFYLGANDAEVFTRLRREMLAGDLPLPVSAEYMHREAYDLTEKYGKDVFLAIYHLGTKFLPRLFAIKGRCDAVLPSGWTDRILQMLSCLFPAHLPARMTQWRDAWEHHLMLQVYAAEADACRAFLQKSGVAFFECTADEARRAHLHRFAAAGAAIRYQALHRKNGLIALDIALRRNDAEWLEKLPPEIDAAIAARLYYGHFFCHVFHQDYLVRGTHDAEAVKAAMLALLDARGAEYPAEHNVGHVYDAKPALAAFYRGLDPTNSFNPGIGKTPRGKGWT